MRCPGNKCKNKRDQQNCDNRNCSHYYDPNDNSNNTKCLWVEGLEPLSFEELILKKLVMRNIVITYPQAEEKMGLSQRELIMLAGSIRSKGYHL